MNSSHSTTGLAGALPAAELAAIRQQARAWAIKLKTGQPTTDDVADFRRWCGQSPAHAQAWAYASEDWNNLGAMAQVLAARHPERIAKPPSKFRNRRFLLGATASAFGSLAVVGMVRPPLGLWPSWSELGADYRTATGEQRDIRLDDRIHVSLNTQTSISVQQGGATPRISLISGEAAVSAQRASCEVLADDCRIVVVDGDVEIRRLATGQVRVRCRQGSAQLHHPLRTVALSAEQQVLFDRRDVGEPARVAPADAGWRQGMVVFDDLPLVEVIEEINRYRPGRVMLMNDALASRRFSAKFSIAALDDAIELLHVVDKVNVRRMGEFVFLS